MSSELNDDARRLIHDALGAELRAGDARREKLKRALLSRAALVGAPAAVALGASEAAGSGAAALPGAAGALPGAGVVGALLAKGAAVGIVVAGALHGATHWGQNGGVPAPSTSVRVSAPARVPAAPASAAVTSGTQADHAAPPPLGSGEPANAVAPVTPDRALSGTSRQEPPAGSEPTLRAELQLMGAVQAALRDGLPARALELIDRHAALYPQGQLENERLAAEAVAACRSGDRARSRRAATLFLQRDPASAMAERVRSVCRTDGGGDGR